MRHILSLDRQIMACLFRTESDFPVPGAPVMYKLAPFLFSMLDSDRLGVYDREVDIRESERRCRHRRFGVVMLIRCW